MSNELPDLNPYASPVNPDGLVQQPVVSTYELLKDVKRFRSEIHALGALWIAVGMFPIGIGILSIVASVANSVLSRTALIEAGIVLGVGLLLVSFGTFTCCKQMWAVVGGLVMCYLLTGLGLLSFNICTTLIFLGGIFGGHRIISWSSEFRRKGIPLTIHPRDIKTPIKLPTFS